jgi:hypothetical protein
MRRNRRFVIGFGWLVLASFVFAGSAKAQVVPGTGIKLQKVGDDFEDEKWDYVPNAPKSSKEQDEQVRFPTGYATNRLWFEGQKRGHPDVIKRVDTPPGGIAGSKGSLLLQSVRTGIPGYVSHKMQQDDFVMACMSRVGAIHVGRTPSVVSRVYLPPFEEWEDRSGSQFGFRIDLKLTQVETKGRFIFKKTIRKTEPFWPGFFIQFHSKTDAKFKEDSAVLLMRGDQYGHEKPGPQMTPGWWTLGMSVTPDGQVHYYAKKGVENLTSKDYLYSSWPYGYRAEKFATLFFNVVNNDDGRTWTTKWIVDDPAVYVLH